VDREAGALVLMVVDLTGWPAGEQNADSAVLISTRWSHYWQHTKPAVGGANVSSDTPLESKRGLRPTLPDLTLVAT